MADTYYRLLLYTNISPHRISIVNFIKYFPIQYVLEMAYLRYFFKMNKYLSKLLNIYYFCAIIDLCKTLKKN